MQKINFSFSGQVIQRKYRRFDCFSINFSDDNWSNRVLFNRCLRTNVWNRNNFNFWNEFRRWIDASSCCFVRNCLPSFALDSFEDYSGKIYLSFWIFVSNLYVGLFFISFLFRFYQTNSSIIFRFKFYTINMRLCHNLLYL